MDNRPMAFATRGDGVDAIEAVNKALSSTFKVDKKTLSRWLSDAMNKADELQNLSEKMVLVNGMLKEIIMYKSYFLTNDHYIYPIDAFKYKNKEKMQKDLISVAQYLELFNLKMIIPYISKSLYEYGEIYLYKKETKDAILMQEIPRGLCKSICMDKYGIARYGINCKMIKEEYLNFFPQEIQKAYKKYNNAKDKKKIAGFSGDYYIVGDDGVCFKFNQLETKGLPYYTHLFMGLMNLSGAEALDDKNNETENYKMLHQKAPMDSSGRPLMDNDDIEIYHNSIKSVVPQAVGVVTTPMEIQPITLADSKLRNYEYINNIKKGIYDNAGISDDLFNGATNNKEAIILSSIIDTVLPLQIQRMVGVYINYELSRKFKSNKWKVEFIESSYYNKEKLIEIERQNLTVYGSKFKYLATMGFTPLQATNIIQAEEMLNIAEKMKPMVTAHTMSNKDNQNKEPEKEDETVIVDKKEGEGDD